MLLTNVKTASSSTFPFIIIIFNVDRMGEVICLVFHCYRRKFSLSLFLNHASLPVLLSQNLKRVPNPKGGRGWLVCEEEE